MEPMDIDRDSARDLLARADASSASTRSAMQSDRGRHARFSALVGLLMAAYLLVTMLFVARTTWLWAVALVLYVGGILWLVSRFNRLRLSAPPRWSKDHRNGMYVSLVFYLGGIALNTAVVIRHDWNIVSTSLLAVPLSVATALPLVIAGYRARRDDA